MLEQSGFKTLLFSKIMSAKDAIEKQGSGVVIFDASGCFSEEITHLRNLCEILEPTPVIVLGKRSVIDMFERSGLRKGLLLSDPLDPERIVTKVKETLSLKLKKNQSADDTLDRDLKAFLNLN